MTERQTLHGPLPVRTTRIQPRHSLNDDCAVPLSLLDATTANFALTSAIWLNERPTILPSVGGLASHLRETLSLTLEAYPQWCGHLKAILSLDGDGLPSETATFPTHAKRYGRVYVHYGTETDPGVEFVEATSAATVDNLYRADAAEKRPIWNRREDKDTLTQYVPSTDVAHALEPREKNAHGLYKPSMAVQYTELACGGFVLAAKIAHPLADIAALTRFVRDWASISRATLSKTTLPVLEPVFEPGLLDRRAAGNINGRDADSGTMDDALSLPMHRYDWWAPPAEPPSPFPPDLPLAGKPLPWAEWDTKAPVELYTVHFSWEQIDHLWRAAVREDSAAKSDLRISKHDALLAHIWSRVVHARDLEDDQSLVHCDLVLGTRPVFQLGDSFIGSPTMMLNIEMTASQVASEQALGETTRFIRETISRVNKEQGLAAHLHSIAYEKSPQRIWQAFLGQRHILVTTWARAGIYNVDFGLGSRVRYADGVVPCMDGCILIVDGPPSHESFSADTVARGWAGNGVEVTIPLRREDMVRLLQDPMLLPKV